LERRLSGNPHPTDRLTFKRFPWEIAPHDLEFRKVIAAVLGRVETFFFGCVEAGQAQGTITSSMPAVARQSG
jgi:TetR/AcrR family transcriptional repressor of nem operon